MTSTSYAAPDLSIVLPLYNAGSRAGSALDAIADFISSTKRSSEVVVVDDGSTDDTARRVDSRRDHFVDLRLLRCDRHRGDGYAARLGMKVARGRERLWVDADAAGDLHEFEGVDASTAADLVIGRPDVVVTPRNAGWRSVAEAVRTTAARRMIGPAGTSPSAGVRWFRAEAADALFGRSRQNDRSLDAELMALARRLGLRTKDLVLHAPATPLNPKLRDTIRLRRLSN